MGKTNILIIDSDESSRLLLEEMIRMVFQETQDYQILSTSSGDEAITMCNENNIKLILSEINIKDVNGLDVTKKIKELYPEIPVIIQTAIITDDTEKNVYLTGADSYLTKPLDSRVITNKIKEVLKMPPSN
ncbi:MAG: response regulator [Bacteroidota bacterium]